AFSAMAEHYLATAGQYSRLQGLTGAERCQVVLHVDINTLREQRAGVCCKHGRAHFEDKPWLSPQTARRLGCDASLVTVLEDGGGQVLNVGRRSRIVPAHIRRALLERDGVCRYPGCHESKYVDAHHIHHWVDGGETSLQNLVVLCRFHHRQLHRGCFEIRLEKNAEKTADERSGVVFRDTSGRRIVNYGKAGVDSCSGGGEAAKANPGRI
ncbi:MAG: HNH endonuclease signature motif containing protein, partial [Halieaceae bacterium]|nr:HNH endonuclease signature motif containing protein [Halieaceae bacterium]